MTVDERVGVNDTGENDAENNSGKGVEKIRLHTHIYAHKLGTCAYACTVQTLHFLSTTMGFKLLWMQQDSELSAN